ncbi:hypothetical protein [Celeribacter sp.]|uniref:hypothetical protein n=1 Tax=Celeribacter sp. TaxID=1890673 RepID=UPI003A8DC43C
MSTSLGGQTSNSCGSTARRGRHVEDHTSELAVRSAMERFIIWKALNAHAKVRVMARQKSIDPQRRAEFKELAREIISKDRAAKKYGASQNTIGEIERALKQAFLDGVTAGAGIAPEPIKSGLIWEQVPPRPRETLASLSFGFSRRLGTTTIPPRAIHRFLKDGKYRWSFETGEGVPGDRSIADGSARPLIDLGLLAEDPNCANRFELTSAGVELCQDYWRRSDADDPTLPKISLRPM